jgi:hypothetical protein
MADSSAPKISKSTVGFLRPPRQHLRAKACLELFGGGVQVSDTEKATLGEISSAPGI